MSVKSKNRRPYGQGMTEYIIIVALIAIAAIGVFRFFGQTVRVQVAGMTSELGGASADLTPLATIKTGATGEGTKVKGLDAYGN